MGKEIKLKKQQLDSPKLHQLNCFSFRFFLYNMEVTKVPSREVSLTIKFGQINNNLKLEQTLQKFKNQVRLNEIFYNINDNHVRNVKDKLTFKQEKKKSYRRCYICFLTQFDCVKTSFTPNRMWPSMEKLARKFWSNSLFILEGDDKQ